MQRITLRSHVDEDGILQLKIPVGVTNAELEVTVTIQPVDPQPEAETPEELGWSPGFFERTFGAWQGEPLVRELQGEYEERFGSGVIYLLDTNTCIGYISRRSLPIFRRITSLPPQDIVLCDIVKLELYYGAYKSYRQSENLAVLRELFGEFSSLPFDGRATVICGQIRARLATLGTPIGPYDLQIAAIALANNLTLVTHNIHEFSRVEGLRLEDWEADG